MDIIIELDNLLAGCKQRFGIDPCKIEVSEEIYKILNTYCNQNNFDFNFLNHKYFPRKLEFNGISIKEVKEYGPNQVVFYLVWDTHPNEIHRYICTIPIEKTEFNIAFIEDLNILAYEQGWCL